MGCLGDPRGHPAQSGCTDLKSEPVAEVAVCIPEALVCTPVCTPFGAGPWTEWREGGAPLGWSDAEAGPGTCKGGAMMGSIGWLAGGCRVPGAAQDFTVLGVCSLGQQAGKGSPGRTHICRGAWTRPGLSWGSSCEGRAQAS